MSEFRRHKYFILGLLFFIMVSISCNLPGAQRLVPVDVIPVSTQAVENLQEEILGSIQNAQYSGEIFLVINEEEITSLATYEIEKLQDRIIQEPQIYLRDGKIQIAANLSQGNILTPIQLVMKVDVDDYGYPSYLIISGTLGPVALPELLREQLKNQIDQILLDKIYSQGNRVFIQSIQISDGVMTIKGYTR